MYSHAVLVDVGRRDGSPRTGHDGSYGVRSLARLCSGRRAQLVAFCVLVYGCLLLLRAGHFYFDRLPHQEEPVLAVQGDRSSSTAEGAAALSAAAVPAGTAAAQLNTEAAKGALPALPGAAPAARGASEREVEYKELLHSILQQISPDDCPDAPEPTGPDTVECLSWWKHRAALRAQQVNRKLIAAAQRDATMLREASAKQGAAETANMLPPDVASKLNSRAVPHKAFCEQLLGIPKVAFLFLIKGPMPHSHLWTRWLEGAAGLIPRQQAQKMSCSPLAVAAVKQYCADSSATAYERQHLFSIYIHARPDVTVDYPPESIFHNRVVPCRVAADWGNLNDAERVLVQQALEDPLNERFVLLSDSDLPLYPASLVWRQLMAEGASRSGACDHPKQQASLYSADGSFLMSPLMFSGQLKPHHWRKSSQWFMLTRSHADLMLHDVDIQSNFRRYCFVGPDPLKSCRRTDCLPEEHYLPTLLAFHNETHNCACATGGSWSLTYDVWPPHRALHPHAFTPNEVTAELFHSIRASYECTGQEGALQSYAQAFVRANDWSVGTCETEWQDTYSPLTNKCMVFARKFSSNTVDTALAVAEACSSGLGLLPSCS